MEKETFEFDLEKNGEILEDGEKKIRYQILASPDAKPLTSEMKKMMMENLKKAFKD